MNPRDAYDPTAEPFQVGGPTRHTTPGARPVVEQPGQPAGPPSDTYARHDPPSTTDALLDVDDGDQWHPDHNDGATTLVLRRIPGDRSGVTSDLMGQAGDPEQVGKYSPFNTPTLA